MARNYTREQQRRYKSERMKQAARVADRLLGVKHEEEIEPIGPAHDDYMDALRYRYMHNLSCPSPRNNIFIGGITC